MFGKIASIARRRLLSGRVSIFGRASVPLTCSSNRSRVAPSTSSVTIGTRSRCGLPASRDESNPPPPPKIEPYKTHLAYVKERRSDKEAAEILQEALQTLRSKRKSGEIVF